MDGQTYPKTIDTLTGMRGWLASWVVLHHSVALIERTSPIPDALRGLADAGYVAVDVFFVLSGFILTHVYGTVGRGRGAPVPAFYRARLARIYPAHLATLGVMVVLFLAARSVGAAVDSRFDRSSFVANVALVHAWDLDIVSTWNNPAWTVSAEWLAYLAYPMLILAADRAGPRASLVAALCLLAAVPIATSLAYGAEDPSHAGLLRVALAFPAGILLYRGGQALTRLPGGRTVLPIVLAALAVAAAATGTHLGVGALWSVPLFGLLVPALSAGHGAWRAVFVSRPVLAIGIVSYSLYLIHYPVLLGANRLVPRHWPEDAALPGWTAALLVFVAVYAAAWMLYRIVERPGRTWLRGEPRRDVPPRPRPALTLVKRETEVQEARPSEPSL